MFSVPKVITRIYDPIREQSYRELGLQTVCPTVMGANAIRDMLES